MEHDGNEAWCRRGCRNGRWLSDEGERQLLLVRLGGARLREGAPRGARGGPLCVECGGAGNALTRCWCGLAWPAWSRGEEFINFTFLIKGNFLFVSISGGPEWVGAGRRCWLLTPP